ncbi:CAP domain-containing protein [Alkalihalobacillus oceani]|uniref:CAP domain-containing protein n=1 Tax=Halalkalibacter oceani TaxID=1653776 RepID=UPI00203C5D18|nr:CAP domain-containing protein [Halalkalibacter oceani]MCM3759319.1 CAP domain-containing protein [Halalkalibacter oceani]
MKKGFVVGIGICLFVFLIAFETMFAQQIKEWFGSSSEVTEIVEEPEEQTGDREELLAAEENHSPSIDAIGLIGMREEEVRQQYGEPARIDPSAYGYDWWIYPLSELSYMQIGVDEAQVVTAFIAGNLLQDLGFLDSGETYAEINADLSFSREVDVNWSFRFQLSDEDLRMRPLIQLDDQWLQLYFDTFTGELSSVRLLTEEVLLLQRPYSVTYRGDLPVAPELSAQQWAEIEKGEARQIFDLTNLIRHRHGLAPVEWDDEVANVAYLHSKDMNQGNYFSHTSPTYGELGDRFENGGIPFRAVGENIAAKYVDGAAAVEGWLNSEGHRATLLHEEFTHLGVGVYQDYYTQNFMTPFDL